MWELKENVVCYRINWLIAMKAHIYILWIKKIRFVFCERSLIARANPGSLLKKRDDLLSKCQDMNKFALKCYKNR